MAVMAGDLVTRLGVDGRKFQSGLDKARGQTRSFAADVTSIVSGIAIADIGKQAIGGIVDRSASVVKLAADAQTAQITFEVLTGDAAKGAKLFKDIQKFASRTSFDLTSAADATKSLLAAGVGDSDALNFVAAIFATLAAPITPAATALATRTGNGNKPSAPFAPNAPTTAV